MARFMILFCTTEIATDENSCQVDMQCKQCTLIDDHSNELGDEWLIREKDSSLDEEVDSDFSNTVVLKIDDGGLNEEKYIDVAAEDPFIESPNSTRNIEASISREDTYRTERKFQHEYYLEHLFSIDGIIKDVKSLDTNKIIIASYATKQLLVIELNNLIKTQIPLSEDPSKLAVINPNSVAIIMRDVDYVLIFDIHNRVSTKLNVGSKCCGIEYLNTRLYIGCNDETIKVMSLEGEIKGMIEIQETEIHNICVSKKKNLYCTNYLNGQLMCIDTISEKIISIPNPMLQTPRGITMDEKDNIIVACHRPTEVFRLNFNGTTTKIMDTETFDGFPCICCDLETGSLIIGGNDTVYIYRKHINISI